MRPVAKNLQSPSGDQTTGGGVAFAMAPGTPCPRCGRTRGVLIGTNGNGGLTETPQPCRDGPHCKPLEPRPEKRKVRVGA